MTLSPTPTLSQKEREIQPLAHICLDRYIGFAYHVVAFA